MSFLPNFLIKNQICNIKSDQFHSHSIENIIGTGVGGIAEKKREDKKKENNIARLEYAHPK